MKGEKGIDYLTIRQTTQDYLINLLEDMCGKITKANDII
jgi:hypothetical protein